MRGGAGHGEGISCAAFPGWEAGRMNVTVSGQRLLGNVHRGLAGGFLRRRFPKPRLRFSVATGGAHPDACRRSFCFLHFPAVTEDDPILAELAAKLAEAETWEDESREKLGCLLAEMRVVFAKVAASPHIPPEERAQGRANLRAKWLTVFEACRKIEEVQEDLLHKGADRAEKMRELSMASVRVLHQIRTAMDAGEFTGIWEQREEWMESIREFEEHKESFMEELSAEDLRQLRDEGVL